MAATTRTDKSLPVRASSGSSANAGRTNATVNWSEVYEDEVDAAEQGVLFQPGYIPQKGKPVGHVIDLDSPGQAHWLSGQGKSESGTRRNRRRK